MKYFIDTEFIEGFKKPLFSKRRHFIDLISIGIVAEDGRTYYAISNEFNPNDADDWVKENVIANLEQKAKCEHDSPRLKANCRLYKNNSMIANDILAFVYPDIFIKFKGAENEFYSRTKEYGWATTDQPEFYGYYADYDWVLFCSLFGRMIDLPKGFPMYCRDLKQVLDEWVSGLSNSDFFQYFHLEAPLSFDEKLESVKKLNNKYPQQTNEHNALADAKWNQQLYNFIKSSL